MELTSTTERVEPIAVSPAELATLVATTAGLQVSPLGELLGLPAVRGVDDPMVTYSMQSLVLRGFAKSNGEQIEVEAEAKVVAQVLASPVQSVLIDHRSERPLAPIRMVRSEAASALFSPLPLGLLATVPVSADLSVAEVVIDASRRIAREGASGEVVVGVEWENGKPVERAIYMRIGDGVVKVSDTVGCERSVGGELDEASLARLVDDMCT